MPRAQPGLLSGVDEDGPSEGDELDPPVDSNAPRAPRR